MRILRFLVVVPALILQADNWPQWRGPQMNGTAPLARDLPVTWTETENVLWRTKLPSWSAATPIVWADTVFITSAEEGFVPLRPAGKNRAPSEGVGPDRIFIFSINRKDG